MNRWLTEAWYGDAAWLKLMLPLSMLFGWLSERRKRQLQQAPFQATVPVVVIGNISIGGTGKTPLCVELCRRFTALGYKVAIVSRGYGGHGAEQPVAVTADSDPRAVGDEAVLLAAKTRCPVIVDAKRSNAVRYAEQFFQPELIFSDDGLQHYAMARSVEIAVVDGARGLGNGQLLPAGPLRERPARLQTVDFVVSNGELRRPLPVTTPPVHVMQLKPVAVVNVVTAERLDVATWLVRHAGEPVHAVAGIGNPGRFFTSLQQLGFVIMAHPFADHHAFSSAELDFADTLPVLMTAKDAVKCRAIGQTHWWYLDVEGKLLSALFADLLVLLKDKGLPEPALGWPGQHPDSGIEEHAG